MRVIKNVWRIICYPLLYLGVQFVVSFAYVIFAAISYVFEFAISGNGFEADELTEFILSRIDLKIPTLLSVFVAFLVMLAILRKEWNANRMWNFKNFGPVILFCLGLGFAMNILTNCVLNLLPAREYSSPLDNIMGSNAVFDFLVFALFAPVLEEIIFRGVVQKRLTKMMNVHGAVFLQAFIFGFIHFNPIQSIYAFVLGVIIGYVYYYWFDSIWFASAIHIAFNGTTVLLLYTFGNSEVDLLYFVAVSVVLFFVSMVSLKVFAGNIKSIRSIRAKNKVYNRWQF